MTTVTRTSTPYVIWSGDHAAIIEVPKGFTSEGYGALQRFFAQRFNGLNKYADMEKLWSHCQHAGVFYSEELASSQGAAFQVYQFPTTPISAVADCCKHIRRSFDVVSLRVLKFIHMHDIQAEVDHIAEAHTEA